jgi:trans-2,3-dihydro-3-hydroxyanthranilate isomerase
MFAPGMGVAEDPATGSAALGLGVRLAATGAVGDGETAYVVRQGAELGRPSLLACTVRVEGGRAVRCRVAGSVAEVARGEIREP